MAVTVDQLLPRLLAGIGEQSLVALEDHLEVHGPAAALRRWAPRDLIALVESAGLRGHGGASFPDCLTLGSSPRRPPKSPGSRPIVQNGLPSASSQEDPCPGSPDRTRGAGRSLQAWIFMPRDASARRRRTQASANSGRCGSWLRQRPAFVGRANAGRPNCGPELRGRRVSDSVPTGLDRLDGPEMHEIRALEDARRR
jgi:hypothetical protein